MTKSLRVIAVEGALWASGQAMVSKVVGFVAQIILAWLLVPADFGVVAMANSVMLLLGIVQSGGLRSILVRRQKNIDLWSLPAFWLSVTLGVVVSLIVLGLTPLLAAYYSQPLLRVVMPIMAGGVIVDSLSVVPTARLLAGLQFRTLGAINMLLPIGQALLSIGLAANGFGAISLVLPKIPVGIFTLSLLWKYSGFRLRPIICFRKWKYLLADSSFMLFGSLGFAAASQVPLIVLARTQAASTVGLYAFAVTFTTQVITLFTAQLDAVLFPTLAKLESDSARQWQAFLKTTRTLGLVVFALNGLQFAVAEPLVVALFDHRWEAAIPYIKWLSLSSAILAAAIPVGSAMQSRGRFRLYGAFAAASLGCSVLCSLGGWFISPNGFGIVYGAVAYQLVLSLWGWKLVTRLFGAPASDLVRALVWPIIACVCGALVGGFLAHSTVGLHLLWLKIFAVATCYFVIWLAILLVFWRKQLVEVIGQIVAIVAAKAAAALK